MAGDNAARRRPLHKRKCLWAVVAVAAGALVVVGPWPTYQAGFEGTEYAEATFARVADLPAATVGPLRAGAASVDITPPVGEPMAGYSARQPKASRGVLDRVFAKAVTLSNGRLTVTIVGADLLLVTPGLREEVLRRVALPREVVYFTATHTHTGPGGYCRRWVYELVLGEYDERIFRRLAEQIASAIRRSRRDLRPAALRRLVIRGDDVLAGLVASRPPGGPTYAKLTNLQLLGADGERLASMVVFGAHATCIGHQDRRISADYPGAVQRAEQRLGGHGVALFAAGAVGGLRITGRAEADPTALPLSAGGRLVERLAEIRAASDAPPRRRVALAAAVLPVDLPPPQYRISRRWRLSPIAAGWLHGRRTAVHVLRVGDVVLLGMPADFSGQLADALDRAAKGTGPEPVVTSFSGDYVGYVIPHARYEAGGYEAMDLNLFGPWCGEYLVEVCRRIMLRMAGDRLRGSTRPAATIRE
jgi:hypothetical protein